jgi:hypothetical protein
MSIVLLCGGGVWNDGYFAQSKGSHVIFEVIGKYIKSQRKSPCLLILLPRSSAAR